MSHLDSVLWCCEKTIERMKLPVVSAERQRSAEGYKCKIENNVLIVNPCKPNFEDIERKWLILLNDPVDQLFILQAFVGVEN